MTIGYIAQASSNGLKWQNNIKNKSERKKKK